MAKDTIKEIIGALISEHLHSEKFYNLVAVVNSVDLTESTCEVTAVLSGLKVYGVRLNANESKDIGVVNVPVIGSNVLISYINKNKAFVSMFSEIESVILTLSDGLVITAGEKLSIKNNGADLKTELDGLIDAIKALTVPTAFGPSGTPINAAVFTSVKTKLDLLLS